MKPPVTDKTVGLWLVHHEGETHFVVMDQPDDESVTLKVFEGGKVKKKQKVPIGIIDKMTIIERIRKDVERLMDDNDTDRGWEAIRGGRTMEEYLEVLGRLPGFREEAGGS